MTFAATLLVAALTFAKQDSELFVGKWQTRISPVTRKHSITVNIIADGGRLSGTVVLVNPDSSEIEEPILNPKVSGTTLRFETDAKGTFYWRLSLMKGSRGLLHGSIGEMLIDEPVIKHRLDRTR